MHVANGWLKNSPLPESVTKSLTKQAQPLVKPTNSGIRAAQTCILCYRRRAFRCSCSSCDSSGGSSPCRICGCRLTGRLRCRFRRRSCWSFFLKLLDNTICWTVIVKIKQNFQQLRLQNGCKKTIQASVPNKNLDPVRSSSSTTNTPLLDYTIRFCFEPLAQKCQPFTFLLNICKKVPADKKWLHPKIGKQKHPLINHSGSDRLHWSNRRYSTSAWATLKAKMCWSLLLQYDNTLLKNFRTIKNSGFQVFKQTFLLSRVNERSDYPGNHNDDKFGGVNFDFFNCLRIVQYL